MNNYERVRAFYEEMGWKIPDVPRFPSRDVWELRKKLINEELDELKEAYGAMDLVEIADALADLLYVTYGTAVDFGIDIQPIFEEVHRTNMLKQSGPKNADGKQLKPEGWKPPDIKTELEKQGWEE